MIDRVASWLPTLRRHIDEGRQEWIGAHGCRQPGIDPATVGDGQLLVTADAWHGSPLSLAMYESPVRGHRVPQNARLLRQWRARGQRKSPPLSRHPPVVPPGRQPPWCEPRPVAHRGGTASIEGNEGTNGIVGAYAHEVERSPATSLDTSRAIDSVPGAGGVAQLSGRSPRGYEQSAASATSAARRRSDAGSPACRRRPRQVVKAGVRRARSRRSQAPAPSSPTGPSHISCEPCTSGAEDRCRDAGGSISAKTGQLTRYAAPL
jgi:hypothetical protein